MEPALYLIPVTLGDTPHSQVLPDYNTEIIRNIRHFIVEDLRSARRFLKKVDRDINIDELTFYAMGKHASPEAFASYLHPLEQGMPVGVISEAGCPAVADPGADVVAIAQRKGLRVIPLVGPSSMILAVMASGFNGQSFAFNGYLPIDPAERTKRIKCWNSGYIRNIRPSCSSRHLTVMPRCSRRFFGHAVHRPVFVWRQA